MADEKDKFGDTMRLAERAKEDIYFAERDREVIEKLRAQLRKVDTGTAALQCPKCPGKFETFSFHDVIVHRCSRCLGVWLDHGELEQIVRKISRGPLGEWIDTLTAKT